MSGSATVAGMVTSIAGAPKGGLPTMPAVDEAPPTAAAPPEVATAIEPVVVRAAGIMLMTKAGQVLFVKRSGSADHSGEWCFPGGGLEVDETAEAAARRETKEEVGYDVDGEIQPWCRRKHLDPAPGGARMVDYTTFVKKIDEPFLPKLNDEHVGSAWAPVGQPPEPLHPGCAIALRKLTMDELDIARAMASGELASPQRYRNVWLFDLRITGTGVAFRSKLNEFVFRRPEHYLTDDYLARCNGLPVVMMHPKKIELDSKEFNDRVVGGMMLPYVKDSEVWGIARIYDDDAAAMMTYDNLSTSPGVILRKADNTKMIMEDGATLLIEGKPALMDHLAICENGVWDKGEGPNGIRSEPITEAEEIAMADDDKKAEDKKEDKKADAGATDKKADAGNTDKKADESKAEDKKEEKKADADAGTQLDKVLAKMDAVMGKVDSVCERMDAFEKKGDAGKKDDDKAEETAADSKKDAEEKKGEEEKKGDSALVAATAELTRRIDQVAAQIPKSMTDEEHHAMADVQARADNVFVALGKRAPRPLDGEKLGSYRRRLMGLLKDYSPTWKAVPMAAFADDAALSVAETQVYGDAMTASTNPADLPAGQLRPVTMPDSTGRQITNFFGEPKAWMSAFGGTPMRLVRINNGSDRR